MYLFHTNRVVITAFIYLHLPLPPCSPLLLFLTPFLIYVTSSLKGKMRHSKLKNIRDLKTSYAPLSSFLKVCSIPSPFSIASKQVLKIFTLLLSGIRAPWGNTCVAKRDIPHFHYFTLLNLVTQCK